MSATSGAGSAPAAGNADRGELARFDSSAARFWDPHGEFRPLHLLNPLRTQFVAERVALAGKRVLDVGCGGGLLAESLARAGAQVTGIDLAPGMIEVARLHAADSGLNIDYRLAAAEELRATARRLRRRHLHGDARARAAAGGHGGDARAAAGPGRCAVRLHAQPQPQVLPAGDRRRRVPAAADSARHARV